MRLQFVVILEAVDKKDARYSSFKHFCFGDAVQHDDAIDVRELGGAIAPLWPLYLKRDIKNQVPSRSLNSSIKHKELAGLA